jgi:hypothetical protein
VVPVSAANCVGDTVDVVITINPEPVLDPNLNNTVCSDLASGITLGIDALNAGVAAASYNIITINKAAGLIAKAGKCRGCQYTAGQCHCRRCIHQYHRWQSHCSIQYCSGIRIKLHWGYRGGYLTVKPEPVMNAGLNGSTCSDSNTGLSLSVAAGSVAAANYNVTDISWDTDLSPQWRQCGHCQWRGGKLSLSAEV